MGISMQGSNLDGISEQRLGGPDAPSQAANGQINILLVDDDAKNLTVLETVLTDPMYRLVRAESADEALLALVREEFALIILDIQMPGMTGFELAHMVKQRKKTAGIPIIFLTAYYSEAEHVLEGYGSGAVDYLHKPVNPTILQSKVAVFAKLYLTTRQIERAHNSLLAEVAERRRVEEELKQLNNELEERVDQRTSELLIANRSIRESEQLLRLAQEAGQVGLWNWDLKTGEGTWTPQAARIFRTHNINGPLTIEKWLNCILPQDRERAHTTFEAAKISGNYRDELRIASKGSQPNWIELVGAVEYEGEEAVRLSGAVRDITERKEMELELKEAHRRKDEFLATLAHELRNPLAPIRNSIQILTMNRADSETSRQITEMMGRQVHHLVRLVDDLMDVSRVKGGKIELRKERVEASSIISGAVETVQPLIMEQCHQLSISVPSESLFVNVDPVRLTQVIGNLLTNAAKYTEPNGRIWLISEREGDEIVLRIRDSGIGIAPEMLPRIFEMFVQADQSATRSQGGLGIGLTLVKNLVEMHGGSVMAHSGGLGKGSEFIVRLPLAQTQDNRPSQEGSRIQSQSSGHRLLVVDDNQSAAITLAMLLRMQGHEVRVAHDGQTALSIAPEFRPEMVFLDLGMPKMDGYEVARRLRRLPGFQQTPLVAITGWGQAEDRSRTAEAGFDHHLVKPAELKSVESLLAGLKSSAT